MVGESAAEFPVHRSIILQSSWFSRALEGPFEEARTGTVRLLSEDPDVFEVYLHWLYRAEIPCRPTAGDTGEERTKQYRLLFEAYFFGDMIGHNNFLNALIHALRCLYVGSIKGIHYAPSMSNITLVWQRIAQSDSPLKRLIIDHRMRKPSPIECHKVEAYHPEFLFDMLRALMAKGPKQKGIVPLMGPDMSKYYVQDKPNMGAKPTSEPTNKAA